MIDFNNLNRMMNSLQTMANDLKAKRQPDFSAVMEELEETNENFLDELTDVAAMKAIMGLRKDLRAEVMRNISRQLLTNIPLLQIQAGTAQSQQTHFSKELKRFEQNLQYVLKILEKSRGGRAAEVELDQDTT